MGNAGKIGIYVDAVNVTMNGGYGLRYDVLRKFASRCGGNSSRLNVYLSFDEERLQMEHEYRKKHSRFCDMLRDFEFKVIEKPLHTYKDFDTGDKLTKSTIDMDMAVDMLVHSEHLDKIILLTSNGGYVSVVNALQNKGVKIELIGFNHVSGALKKSVDFYASGFTIPGLLPIESSQNWGEAGSRVRGVCYDFSTHDGYGFMRFLTKYSNRMWLTDSRDEDSPYKTVFAHISHFEDDLDMTQLPSRDLIFEFDVVQNDKGLVAENIELINGY